MAKIQCRDNEAYGIDIDVQSTECLVENNYYSGNSLGQLRDAGANTIRTFDNNDATPSVANGRFFRCATNNTSSLDITMLDDGVQGQVITILGGNPTHKTTIKDTTDMNLNGDWVEQSEATLTLFFDGTSWYEISRRHTYRIEALVRPTALKIQPEKATIQIGKSIQFTVYAFDADGNPLPIKGEVIWSIEGDIGVINHKGLFAATTTGNGKVVAKSGSLSAQSQITVTLYTYTYRLHKGISSSSQSGDGLAAI